MPKKKNAVRADGRISVQVYLGRDEDGKRKYKTVYGQTQKEADAKAEQIKLSLRKGLDVSAENDAFGEWAERWLRIKRAEVSEGQAGEYAHKVRHINSYIENAPLKKIRTIDLQEIILDLAESNPHTKRPSSRRVLEITKNTLSQIFEMAIENRAIEFNPASALKIPKDAPTSTRRALFDHEREWIHATEHRAKTAAMIMMYSGLRRGELIPLLWSDIDLAAKTISVSKTVKKSGNRLIVKLGAKTEASVRTVDIPEVLVGFLKERSQAAGLVCAQVSGKMHTHTSFRQMWSSYQKELNITFGDFTFYERASSKPGGKRIRSKFDPGGVPFVIPKITPHWLRHTFATLLYHAEVDILTAKEQMGHKDIKTTLKIYTHLDRTHKRKSMSKLDEYLAGASQMQVKTKTPAKPSRQGGGFCYLLRHCYTT